MSCALGRLVPESPANPTVTVGSKNDATPIGAQRNWKQKVGVDRRASAAQGCPDKDVRINDPRSALRFAGAGSHERVLEIVLFTDECAADLESSSFPAVGALSAALRSRAVPPRCDPT